MKNATAKKTRPGEEFESSFRASVPRDVYVRRLRTPTSMGFVVPRFVDLVKEMDGRIRRLFAALREQACVMKVNGGGLSSWCKLCDNSTAHHAALCPLAETPKALPDWVEQSARFRFTPKSGVDFLLAAPARAAELAIPCGSNLWSATIAVRPSLFFALELKSVERTSFPWSKIDPDQERALEEAALAGHHAFVVIEFRGPGEVIAVPFAIWRAMRAASSASTLHLEIARGAGMKIDRDVDRGLTKTYWKVAEWLVACGADLPLKPSNKNLFS